MYGGNNWPLRGLKNTLWEGGIKGIGSIKIPNVANGARDQLMHVSDIFPTLIDLTGCPISGEDFKKLDGASQSKMLKENDKSAIDQYLINIDPKYINHHSDDNRTWTSPFDVSVQAGLRWKNWKLLTGNPEPAGYPSGHIYPPEWPKESNIPELMARSASNVRLFDIASDPLEMFDQSNDRTDIVEKMLDILVQYNSTAVPVLKPKPDPNGDPDKHNGFWEPWVFPQFQFDNQL